MATSNWRTLPWFLVTCLMVFLFGGLFQPGDWYAELNIAPWSPPGIAFPIVWSILYIMIAVAGCLIFNSGHTILKVFWAVQLIMNAGWSWIFFGQHWVVAALIEIVALGALVLLLIIGCFRARLRLAAWLLLPYLLWLELATTLNAYIVQMN
ncbi:MAG: tryptophan-rich sensory protein [Arenicella sp.]|nr:tryptophan-rich sensory protein [Arenicella sp.]